MTDDGERASAKPARRLGLRGAGLAMAGGGTALGIAFLLISLHPLDERSVTPSIAVWLLLAAALLLLALPALYLVQAVEAGGLGLAGHALLSVGLLLLVVVSATPILHPEVDLPPPEDPLLFGLALAFAVGLLATGLATWRAAVMPRGATILLVLGMAGFVFAFWVAELLTAGPGQIAAAVAALLLAGGFIWLGVALWRRAV